VQTALLGLQGEARTILDMTRVKLLTRVQHLESKLQSVEDALYIASLERYGHEKKSLLMPACDDSISRAGVHIAARSIDSSSHPVVAQVALNISSLPERSTIWVTFVNGDAKYRELMFNWALHLRNLGVLHVVVAFDDTAAATCQDHNIPYIR
jgi:hypothetical protein